MGRLFTDAEREALRRADAEIDREFEAGGLTREEIEASRDRDAEARAGISTKRAYYAKNRKRILAYKKAYRAAHKAEIAAYYARWYQEHREEHLANCRDYNRRRKWAEARE